jgi:hypothetical protein
MDHGFMFDEFRFNDRARVIGTGRTSEGGGVVSDLVGGGCGGGLYF